MKSSTTDKIYGLVLSGGKSTRMGMDKGTIAYHGTPQREYLYNLLDQVCNRTFLSIRSEQENDLPKGMNTILDENQYKGPYNGLLSAHHQYPDVAWLVLACDLPLMDLSALKQLINDRTPDKIATAFATRDSQLPEPLAAIWEPKGLQESIIQQKNANSSCPRKFLIQSDVALVYPNNEQVLLNANDKEEYEKAITKITAI